MDKFNSFRKWFNQLFSLSFDGKFKGLSTLLNLYGSRFIDHFIYKVEKLLSPSRSKRLRPVPEIIVFRLSGHTIKLYNR